MHFKISYDVMTINREAYTAAVRKFIEGQMKIAAAKFAAAALRRIPIRTGFVAGAFSVLTNLLGEAAKFNPIVAHTNRQLATVRKQSKFTTAEYYYPGSGVKILKTTTSGKQFATATADIIRASGFNYSFNFAVDITYFNIQDVSRGRSPSSPWGAFKAGKEAFIAHMESVTTDFPRLSDFIIKRRVTVG